MLLLFVYARISEDGMLVDFPGAFLYNTEYNWMLCL